MTPTELKRHINQSGFLSNPKLRSNVKDIIWHGLLFFRVDEKRNKYSYTGKLINKPNAAHYPSM